MRICVLGGAGFVGRHLVARLASDRHEIRVVTRKPQRHRALAVLPGVSMTPCDVLSVDDLSRVFAGCDAVVNLVGILNESRRQTFAEFHIELVRRIVQAARARQVGRLLHMSALQANVANGPSAYLRSKGEGENIAHTTGKSGIAVTSFQPSVIFGPDDSFFNRFAQLLRIAPGVLPLACPQARFAPAFVGDVAEVMARSLTDARTHARRYPLCGPRSYSLRELVRYTARVTGRPRWVVGLNDTGSRLQARLFERIPGKPFTMDNYLSATVDSVCADNGFAEFGISPVGIEAIVPDYLTTRGADRHRYHSMRGRARR